MEKHTTTALLYLDGITVSFDGFKALNELSFIIEPGEMRAIIGPNGAGKTTMMDVVTGKTRPDDGDVFFEEGTYDLSKLDETEIAELGIGRKFQKPTVFDMHTVEDNLLLALKNDRRVRATLLWQNSAEQAARIDSLLPPDPAAPPWLLVAGVGALSAGAVFLVSAAAPRPKRAARLAAQAARSEPGRSIGAAIDAKRGELYVQAFDAAVEP